MSVWCSECGALQAIDELTEELEYGAGTRHHALLNSNEVPVESELPTVESTISKIDASLAIIGNEILGLHYRIKELNEERDRLSSYRAQNCAILSPLRRMPPEILAEIFSWTAPKQIQRRRDTPRPKLPWPWALTRISRRWRDIVVSTPSLWSRVVIDFEAYPTPSYSLPMLEAQIARAQKLKIHLYGSEFESSSKYQVEMFRYLAQHSSRWEEFYFHSTRALSPLLADIRGQVPSLRVLRIQWNDDRDDSDGAAEPIDFVESAPSLVDVGVFNAFTPMPISLPAHQLTRYELRAPWDMHKAILTRAPNLVEAHIDVRFGNESWLDTGEIIDLPELDRLYTSTLGVLRYIRTPVLQGLALSPSSADRTFIVSELKSFLSRSACTLRRLCLSQLRYSDIAIAILKTIPSLTEFGIMLFTFNFGLENLMEELGARFASEAIVAPQLSTVLFGNTYRTSGSAFAEMVESRWKSPHCALTRALLLTDSTPNSRTLEILESLRQEGLDFRGQEDAASVRASWVYSRESSP
ncbi:hypothetical protein C8R45DRAFT_414324 [Mycena sanguinolenta]|nr:hypothetical protein C8R45DRAFT_414324 [Mycena sanguinolenta]